MSSVQAVVKRLVKRNKYVYVVARWLVGRPLHKRRVYTWSDMSSMAEAWAATLPMDFDVVVGVPRAGLVVGSVVAEELGLPLCTPEGFGRGEFWYSKLSSFDGVVSSALVVDDAVCSGQSMVKLMADLRSKFPFVQFFSGVMVLSGSGFKPDFYFVADPRFCHTGDVRKLAEVWCWDWV